MAMTASGALLLWARRTTPMDTAYAVWTGIGSAGAFTLGVFLFGDLASMPRMVSIAFIVAGIVGLKIA
jgi:quaternary ammonium compound-resistance protein SugE